jgi:hypothetical protein
MSNKTKGLKRSTKRHQELGYCDYIFALTPLSEPIIGALVIHKIDHLMRHADLTDVSTSKELVSIFPGLIRAKKIIHIFYLFGLN